MFKKITNHTGFWKSVLLLTVAFSIVFFLIRWVFSGFDAAYLALNPRTILAMLVGGFIYGLFVTYGKFWRKLKQKEAKNK